MCVVLVAITQTRAELERKSYISIKEQAVLEADAVSQVKENKSSKVKVCFCEYVS